MHYLLCEIWSDEEESSNFCFVVSESQDRLRKSLYPNGKMIHSFRARSDFEMFAMKNFLLDHGPWVPESDWEEVFFSEEESEQQRMYLLVREI